MKTTQPLVSIITPVYNGSKYIEELIKSVLEQDYQSIEHIVIDDGSKDNGETVGILQRYPHLRWWSRENKGQYSTLNEGITASRGELITLICADDKYASATAISSAVRLYASRPHCDAVYGDTIKIDATGRIQDNEPPRSAPVWMFRYYPNAMSHCSLLVKNSFLRERGILFDPSFKYFGDYDWIMRLIRSGCRFERLREPIAMYRQHPSQISQESSESRTREANVILSRFGKPNPLFGFLVNKWWRLTKLKNLCRHRGITAGLTAFATYLTKASTPNTK